MTTSKPYAICVGCPREHSTDTHVHAFVDAPVPTDVDLLVVAEAPVCDRYGNALGTFLDDAGRIIRTSAHELRQEPKYEKIKIDYTYAVLCTSNQGDKEPSKAILNRCRTLLLEEIRQAAKKPVLLVMGMTALRALGIKAAKLKDMQGRLLPQQAIGADIEGQKPLQLDVVVTVSTKQLVAVPGIYTTFTTDFRRAADAACKGGLGTVPSLESLTKDYRIPKTIREVKDICREIIEYKKGLSSPDNWPISVDTETNTKFPHRDKLKVLAVSFAWDEGKATAIPLWHQSVPYEPEEALPFVKEVLACQKPKFLHNAKFDLKVFFKKGWPLKNFVWDSMLAEHILEEDKKGQYGLKQLTRTFFPDFATYADALQELLTKQEGDSQLDNLRSIAPAEENDGGFEKIPIETLLLYAAVDADMTRRLVLLQEQRIVEEQNRLIEIRNTTAREQQLARIGREKMSRLEIPTREEGDMLLKYATSYPIPDLCDSPKPVKRLALKTVFPVTPVLAQMEFRGICVDRPYLSSLQVALGNVVEETEKQLKEMADGEVTLNSPVDVARVLFEDGFIHPTTHMPTKYPLDGVSRTKKGQIQTTEKVMQFLVAKYNCPFAAKKLIYAKAFKAKNTFCRNVGDLSALDGYLHTTYNQHGTSTGRLSSADENMQNIPKKLAGVNIKKVFIPDDESYLFVNADAKGAEVRILTAYCRDPALIQSLNSGQDTHCFIAAKIVEIVRQSPNATKVLATMYLEDQYPLTYEDFANRDKIKVSDKTYGGMLDKFRTAVKRVVFGILYGAGPQKIAETIGISLDQARQLIEMLFKLFPSIKTYMAQTKWELKQFHLVETYFGRRRRFSVEGAPHYLQGRAERQTVNFKIQSTSSDIVMGRLVAIEEPLKDLGGRLLLTVHDSLGFQIKKKYVRQLPEFIHTYLEKGAAVAHPWLPVAFKWDYEVGPSYGELQSVDSYLANLPTEEDSNDAAEAYTEEDAREVLAED